MEITIKILRLCKISTWDFFLFIWNPELQYTRSQNTFIKKNSGKFEKVHKTQSTKIWTVHVRGGMYPYLSTRLVFRPYLHTLTTTETTVRTSWGGLFLLLCSLWSTVPFNCLHEELPFPNSKRRLLGLTTDKTEDHSFAGLTYFPSFIIYAWVKYKGFDNSSTSSWNRY